MTEEFISRAKALSAVQKQRGANRSPAQNDMLDRICRNIKNMPAADVAPVVQGSGKVRATDEAETTQIIDGCCTACGAFMDYIEAADYKFCPYCAKRIV